jgi:hypothetical protein
MVSQSPHYFSSRLIQCILKFFDFTGIKNELQQRPQCDQLNSDFYSTDISLYLCTDFMPRFVTHQRQLRIARVLDPGDHTSVSHSKASSLIPPVNLEVLTSDRVNLSFSRLPRRPLTSASTREAAQAINGMKRTPIPLPIVYQN